MYSDHLSPDDSIWTRVRVSQCQYSSRHGQQGTASLQLTITIHILTFSPDYLSFDGFKKVIKQSIMPLNYYGIPSSIAVNFKHAWCRLAISRPPVQGRHRVPDLPHPLHRGHHSRVVQGVQAGLSWRPPHQGGLHEDLQQMLHGRLGPGLLWSRLQNVRQW